MSYKKDELLGHLITALEQIESVIEQAYLSQAVPSDISPALEDIERAKKAASSRDRALIEEFESHIKRFIHVRVTPRNVREVREMLRQFGSEVRLAMVVTDYSDDEYNVFLKLLEKPGIRDYVANLRQGEYKTISGADRKNLLDLGIVEERDDKIQLTERGVCLARALDLL